jgi:hypothetical protein
MVIMSLNVAEQPTKLIRTDTMQYVVCTSIKCACDLAYFLFYSLVVFCVECIFNFVKCWHGTSFKDLVNNLKFYVFAKSLVMTLGEWVPAMLTVLIHVCRWGVIYVPMRVPKFITCIFVLSFLYIIKSDTRRTYK